MSEPFRVAIFEAVNHLVGFNSPTSFDIAKNPSNGLIDYLSKHLYGVGITNKKLRWRPPRAMPMQGPVLAANLLKKRYRGKAVEATVYIPGVSVEASTLAGVRDIIKRSDVVAVSALSVNSWAQQEIIRIAKEEGKKTIATGAHARMYAAAKRLLGQGPGGQPLRMPASRHLAYNDRLILFPGSDYVIQYNQYDAFLDLVALIRQGTDSPETVKSIEGVGFCDSEGNVRGLTEQPCDMMVPQIPDVIYDPKVIDGYDTQLKTTSFTGSGQGCIYACEFCQIKKFMGNTFIHNPPNRVYDNLVALYNAGLLRGHFNPLLGSLDNSVFFSDDSPVLGGVLEEDMPFDYIEFSKTLDYIGSLKRKKRRIAANALPLRLPEKVIAYIQARNPAMLTRMESLGLSYTNGGEIHSKDASPLDLSGTSWSEAIGYLQRVVVTGVDDPRQRPFAGQAVQDTVSATKMGRQLRRNYVEFSKLLDEIEQFERDYHSKPSFSIEMSVRAILYLQRHNPFALQRMHQLGFDILALGFEDLISEDTQALAGIVKSTSEENKEAIEALKEAGIAILAMIVCPAEIYKLGDVRKTVEKALGMGVNAVQIWAEQPYDGTPSTKKHIERQRSLPQVAGDRFDEPWRNLVYGLQRGELVTMRPDKASMLGLQLDLLDAITYFDRLSNHWPLLKAGWRKKGWRTALYGLGFSSFECAAMARDLQNWLFHTPVREGKCHVQLLAEIDPRWKKEEYTLRLIRQFGIEEMLNVAQ